MRAIVDTTTCISNGLCEALASAVFRVGEDCVAHVLLDPVPSAEAAATRRAAKICPKGAITLEETL